MDWSCRALFLVAVTTDKELSSPQVQGDQGQSRGISTHSFLLSTVVHSQMHLELSRAEVRRPEASVNIFWKDSGYTFIRHWMHWV